MPTKAVRVSNLNYEAIKIIADREGCSVSFVADLALSQFLKSGLDLSSLRRDIEEAYAVAVNKFLTPTEVSRETNF
jgi:hypothetical protein